MVSFRNGKYEYLTARKNNRYHSPKIFPNGDALNQLLARRRYLLFKTSHKRAQKQKIRPQILYKTYPDLNKAYNLATKLNYIYEK